MRATSGYFCDHKGLLYSDLIYPCRLAANGPIKALSTKGRLWSQLSLEARSICRPADCTSLGLLSHFPSSYSNDPILIHIGTSPNWCQVSDFNIHHQSTSNKSWHTNPASWCFRPEVCLHVQESTHAHAHTHTQRYTCLIGIARPLPMLSALLSSPFFSLSGSLPFRDCRVKAMLTLLTQGFTFSPHIHLLNFRSCFNELNDRSELHWYFKKKSPAY